MLTARRMLEEVEVYESGFCFGLTIVWQSLTISRKWSRTPCVFERRGGESGALLTSISEVDVLDAQFAKLQLRR